MPTKSLFQQALNIQQPWYVQSSTFNVEQKRLDIYLDFRRGAKFPYVDSTLGIKGEFNAYDTVEKTWRHLNFFEHECYLHARVPRVDLGNGVVRMITPPWAGVAPGFTLLFEALIVQLCQSMTVHEVCHMIHESDRKIWAVLESYVDQARAQEDFRPVQRIGIDETALKRGHQYITLFVDLDARRTLFVTEGKDSATVERFANELDAHNAMPLQVAHVSCDMSPAYIKGVTEQLPGAEITFDKFHVMSLVNNAVDEVRRLEAKTQPILKHSRYAVLKNESNLTVAQRQKRNELSLSKLRLKTVRAMHLRESFQAVYNASSKEEFVVLLRKWHSWARRCRLAPMKEVAGTIKRHWDGIVQWKTSQITNGILEGINSLIQAAKAKARGYRTQKTIAIITYLLTGKLNFASVNPNLLPT